MADLKSPQALHGFLTGLYKKVPDEQKREKALEVTDTFLADYRATARSFLFDGTQVEGYRSFVMAWQPTSLPPRKQRDDIHQPMHALNVKVMGVRDDGRITGGTINITGYLDEGSLGQSWAQQGSGEDPHRSVAEPMARVLADTLEGRPSKTEDLAVLHSLTGWEDKNIDEQLDPQLPLPLNARGGKAFAYARENQRTAQWALKRRLRDSGVIDYNNEDTEENSQRIFSGAHRLSAAIMQQEQRGAAYICASLTRQIDPDVLKIARSLNEISPESINYLMGQPATGENTNSMMAFGFDEFDEDDILDDEDDDKSDTRATRSTPEPKPNLTAYDNIPVDPVYGDTSTPEDRAENAQRRHQAIAAYPSLAGRIMRTTGLTKTVDTGQPLAPLLTTALNLSPAHLKRLQGQTWQRTGRDFYRTPDTYTRSLNAAAVDHVPQNRKQWRAFTTAYTLAQEYGNNAELFTHHIMADLKGRYDTIAKIGENHVNGGIPDASRHIAAHLTRPATAYWLAQQGMDEDTIKTWIGPAAQFDKTGPTGQTTGLRQALETADKWHRVQARFDAAMLPAKSETQPWPTLAAPETLEELTVVPLNSSQLLQQEGLKQNHCVGGYTQPCLDGQSLIYSLRRNNSIQSTIEINLRPDDKKKNGYAFSIGQNMGKGNGSAPNAANKAGKALLSHLGGLDKATIEQWRHDIGTENQKRRAQKKTLKDQIGYDPFDKSKIEQAYDLMRPALPKSWAKKSFDQWMEQTIGAAAQKTHKKLLENLAADKETKQQSR